MEHVDVLIIGAGISGIGAGCHLTMTSPDQSYAVLESRENLGGTWDLFKYPGIRSDSDMETERLVNLRSGYFLRALDVLPKQGKHMPWRNPENYLKDYKAIRWGKINDGVMVFE